MKLQNPLIALHKVTSNQYFTQQTMDLFLNPWNGLPAQYLYFTQSMDYADKVLFCFEFMHS